MTPDETAPLPFPPPVAAPRRAVPLKSKPAISPEEILAAAKAQLANDISAKPIRVDALERKLDGLHDAQDMLRVLNTQLLLQRTARLHGSGGRSRQAMRVLSVTVLFALLIAALAAMSWMQSRLAQHGISRHRVEIRSQK